jgi:Flp pilus assembly protein TadG
MSENVQHSLRQEITTMFTKKFQNVLSHSALKRHEQGQRGAAMVEFAIILPLLILLLFGIIEFGLLLFNKQVITNASREGARYGIVARVPRYADSDIESVVNNYVSDYLVSFASPTPSPTTQVTRTGTDFQDDLTVVVTYPYDFLALPMGPVNLHSQTVMKYE